VVRFRVLWEAHVRRFQDALDRYKKGRLTARKRASCSVFLVVISAASVCVTRPKVLMVCGQAARPRLAPPCAGKRTGADAAAVPRGVRGLHGEALPRGAPPGAPLHPGLHGDASGVQSSGQVRPAEGRGRHRKKRVRRPLPGMLLFQDGSTHRWIAALVTMSI